MRRHKLLYSSSYDRGLDILLFMWPDILKKFPDAELSIAYGWETFDVITRDNPERQQWKASIESLMNQPNVIHHGRLGKEELKKLRQECGVWAYPTYFPEINCISALEAQQDGCVPVTMNSFALTETVGAGVLIEGEIKDPEVQETYLKELLLLMDDKARWKELQHKGEKFAKKYSWDKIASKWTGVFNEPTPKPLVSVITCTIRTGFWNIMAENLSKQSYKNFEWIIVDDYQEDRSAIALKYALKYNLNIRYLRGELGRRTRKYGLVQANNRAWKAAKGELLVFLQDFILIPQRGIEDLVTLYNHHPNAILAPTDDYFNCVAPNRENKEDWFDGKTNIITTHDWRNVRNQFAGIRKSDNSMDFEMNWGAIPKSIVDVLNGWWEFYDNGLGFDNVDIAFRAKQLGYYILVDDTNVATCINLWPFIGGTAENITERERNLGSPLWKWQRKKIDEGKLPLIRDEELDSRINLTIHIPEEIPDKDCPKWLEDHSDEIVTEWEKDESFLQNNE